MLGVETAVAKLLSRDRHHRQQYGVLVNNFGVDHDPRNRMLPAIREVICATNVAPWIDCDQHRPSITLSNCVVCTNHSLCLLSAATLTGTCCTSGLRPNPPALFAHRERGRDALRRSDKRQDQELKEPAH